MNREIKFRVWDLNNLEWGNADCLECGNQGSLMYYGHTPNRDKFTLQQFTGLKDKNGKDIYEGDVLFEYEDNRQKILLESDIYEVRDDLPKLVDKDVVINSGYIFYSPPEFKLRYFSKKISGVVSSSLYYNYNYEIVGNIFENPEYLK